ncbi:hypothetical protein HOU03_gp400 [Caulobacter phage CcrSC]|uniref:Uncharacterized protein n=1 Tax=Caulobacter phage CcrSC TaxID=2283272 RepID=A0A385EG74_9CAUD|nr:hypothetical protein HOU03_gp400 [Caulobacter phage CcrSC]AXQ69868.1 hypothetical protein CcrSC_gp286 [Caulobacter phage CcrSC]
MHLPDDAIRWKVKAPRLLPLIPRPWLQEAAETVRAEWSGLRRGHHEPSITSYQPFVRDVPAHQKLNPGLSFIYTNGVAQYHTDGNYPRFFYLLILHSRSYCVDGGAWPEPFAADRPGDLICLDSHLEHGLRAKWLDGPEDLDPEEMNVNRCLPNFWLALSMDSWALLTPEQTIMAYSRALEHNNKNMPAQALEIA